MKARPLSGTLQGERLLGIDPALASQVAAGWRRRLNLFTGRALTEPALSLEQYGRESHLAIRGQRVSAGVVQGLEVVLGTGAAAGRLHLEPGYGIAASGEDVVVPAAGSYAIESLPVYAPATLLHPIEGGEEPPADSEETGGLLARRLSRMNLGELRAALGAEPETRAFEAGILVAQPVTFHETAQPQEVCDDDQSARAFEDEVRIDGARLVLYAWPVEWLPLPAGGDQWRNRLAYAIFERELALAPDEVLPWEALGVPLALLGFDTAGAPLFADRAAVVRDGGKPRPRARLGRSHRDTPFLWQARMQQLGEHLAEPSLAGRPIDEVAREFRFLPPAGLLPRDAIDPVQRQGRFFPSAFRETAVPAPLEQLDVALESSAALAPYDLAVADDVELIVPVPQVWYEPRLLQTDEVSPAFQQAIDGFVERRGVWLLRREDVRGKADAIERAIRARERDWPDPDPGKIDPEEAVAESQVVEGDAQLSEPEAAYGTIDVQGELHVEALDELRARLAETPVRHFTSVPLTALPAGVTLPAGIPITHEGGSLAFRGLMTEAQRNTLLGLSSQAAYQQAVRALFDRSQRDDLSQLDRLGVEGFIQYLEGKVRRADDTLDLGFLNVQTDIYRIRQVMLGAEAATRLATSPALATIARGETAAATKDDLARFFETARGAGGAPLTTGPTGPSTPSGGAPGAATPGGGASEPLTNLRGFTTGAIARGVSETAFSAAFTPSIRDIAEGVAARPRPEVEIAAEQPAVEVPLRGGAQPLFRPEISKEVIRVRRPYLVKRTTSAP